MSCLSVFMSLSLLLLFEFVVYFSVSFSCRVGIQVISCFISCSSHFLLLLFSLHFQSPAPPLFVSPVFTVLHGVFLFLVLSICWPLLALMPVSDQWLISQTDPVLPAVSAYKVQICFYYFHDGTDQSEWTQNLLLSPFMRRNLGYWGVAVRPENSRFPVSVRP